MLIIYFVVFLLHKWSLCSKKITKFRKQSNITKQINNFKHLYASEY